MLLKHLLYIHLEIQRIQVIICIITGFINNKLNRWSNGDYISAQDIRDYLEYILDINTGSQKLDEILKYGIRGAEKFINTQKEYLAKYNRNYINLRGRRKYILDTNGNYIQDPKQQVWQPQIKDASGKFIDTEDVKKIKEASFIIWILYWSIIFRLWKWIYRK
ncbi:hypothetical protein ONA24_06720 [Mycoplasmopsis cynos]|uniref:hypothetical protein n=1 Tax=Mycoplasmopsis cynos TaxID=171284 RepID=UPI0024CA071A|nr:hypothetical protein [Mycoplasmopsis cynos]WAM09635.1 hypothetical protein ONA24_06720 [Mycoplasmopsis cynos]